MHGFRSTRFTSQLRSDSAPRPRGEHTTNDVTTTELLNTHPAQCMRQEAEKPQSSSKKRPHTRGRTYYPRKRSNRACQVCRTRKTKCDNGYPSCSYCVSIGATCVQSESDTANFDPASLKILNRLDDLEQLLLQEVCAPPAIVNSSNSVSPIAAAGSHASAVVADPEPLCRWSHFDHGASAQTGGQLPAQLKESTASICRILPQRVGHILQWCIFAPEEEDAEDRQSLQAPHSSPSPSFPAPSSLVGLLDSYSCQVGALLDSFFAHVHGSNPILDESSARRIVRDSILNGIDWSPESCLTLIICALGCLGSPYESSEATRPGTQAYAEAKVLFEAAQKRMGLLLMTNDLVSAQCLFLSGVYMMYVFQPVHGWRYFLQAVAICQSFPSIIQARKMGITLATSPSTPWVDQKNTQEQAVYWSAWKSEQELRDYLSLPDFDTQSQRSILYPPFFPTPPTPSSGSPKRSHLEDRRVREAWLFYLADISLRRLTSRVCNEMLSLQQSIHWHSDFLASLVDMIPDYEAQAQEWRNNLPNEVLLSPSIQDDNINQFVLRGRMMNFFETIYWPFVEGALSWLASGRPVPSSIYELARRGLDTHITQIEVNETGFYHKHHGCFFMIRSCTRSALVLLAAGKLGAEMPPLWENAVHKVAQMLQAWEDEDPELQKWRGSIEHELEILSQR